MAILTGQNIGANQRGILNLGATINTPLDTTLRNVTDGMGNNSPLQLSTTQASFAGFATAPTADIVWRTNPTLTDYTGWHQTDGTFRILTKNNASLFINIASSILFSNGLSAQSIMSSNGALGLGIASPPSARLHVRGDGTNAIARFEDSSGTANILEYENTGRLFGQTGNSALELLRFQRNNNRYFSYGAVGSLAVVTDAGGQPGGAADYSWINFVHTINHTSGLQNQLGLNSTVSNAAGNMNYRSISTRYTINNTGAQTGTATGIFLNATETALNGMGHNLMDLQVGNVSQFRVSRTGGIVSSTINLSGALEVGATSIINWAGRTTMASQADGNLLLRNSAFNSFGLIQLGGTTNAFPAIKRNGAAIDFRLADDSAFCRVDIGSGSRSYGEYRFCDPAGNNGAIFYGQGLGNGLRTFWMNNGQILFSGNPSGGLVSAAIQIDSTTQGFLPPRMTTTQINAIATPAEGLVVYNTTISHLCVYQAGAWVKLSHSPM